jgi:hypothetical protein
MPVIDYRQADIFVGDTTTLVFEALDKDGTPIDLTGATVSGQVNWLGGSVAVPVATVVPSNGTYAVILDPTLAAQIPRGQRSRLTTWMTGTDGYQVTLRQKPLRVLTR